MINQSFGATRDDHPNREGVAGISATRPAISPIPREGDLELAPQQENWWYNEFLVGHVRPNNVHLSFRLTGPIQADAIDKSAAILQRRHEALRTAFIPRNQGGAAVVITPPDVCELPVAHLDLTHLEPLEQSAMLRAMSKEEQDRPFDLTQGNLCRIVLIRLGAEDHAIILTIHHLVSDEWSMDILISDFTAVYASVVNGTPLRLRPLAFQYVDFARWQRNWLSSPEAAKQFSFWRRRLAPPLNPLLPSADGDHDPGIAYLVPRGSAPIVIGATAVEIARQIARGERCTLFSTLIAVVKTLLHAYSRQTDIRVGTPVANRGLPGAEQVVGLFTNIVCLRSRIDPAITFREFLRGAHETILDAADNQDLPYEIMARDLGAFQQTPRDGMLHAMVIWMTMTSPESSRFPGVKIGPAQSDHNMRESVVFVRNTIDLRFELTETSIGIIGNITYNLSRFPVTDIQRMAGSLERCLMLAGNDPEVTMGRLSENLPFPAR